MTVGLDRLEDDLRSDPWIHRKFRKLMCGPLRVPYKNELERRKVENNKWWHLFMVGAVLSSPVAIWYGKRFRTTQGGVPKTYVSWNYHQFPSPRPYKHSRRLFLGAYGAILSVGGYAFASYFHKRQREDEFFTRPDTKPIAPMCENDFEEAREEYFNSTFSNYWVKNGRKEEQRRNGFYRYFFPNSADYSVKVPKFNRDPAKDFVRRNGKETFPTKTRMAEASWA